MPRLSTQVLPYDILFLGIAKKGLREIERAEKMGNGIRGSFLTRGEERVAYE